MAKKPTLVQIEAQHGFTFGNPADDTGNNANRYALVTCSNPTCDQRGVMVSIHDDTTRPVHCGGTAKNIHGEPVACYTELLPTETPNPDASIPPAADDAETEQFINRLLNDNRLTDILAEKIAKHLH